MSYYLKAGTCFEENYKTILKHILENGRTRDVRGFKTKELSPFCWTTNSPLDNVLTNPVRKINKAFSIAEWLWMMAGRNDVEMVSFYNKNIATFANGSTFDGAYGPKIKFQLDYVLTSLINDPGCRQAIINIWNPNPKKSKDIPCTLTMQFLINKDELDMLVNMRSNDAWLGLPYDFYNFTMIQNYVAYKLNLKVGRYTHFAASEHLYSEHFKKAAEICDLPTYMSEVQSTEPIQHDELSLLLSAEESMRRGQSCDLILGILHEPWKSMALELKKYCDKKCLQR